MLTIRREQMLVLETRMAKRFRARVRVHLRRELAKETEKVPDADLLRRIDEAILRGRKYGVTTERDVMLFVDLTFILSQNFEDAPDMRWAKKILINKEMEGDAKMSLIYQQLAARQTPPESHEVEI